MHERCRRVCLLLRSGGVGSDDKSDFIYAINGRLFTGNNVVLLVVPTETGINVRAHPSSLVPTSSRNIISVPTCTNTARCPIQLQVTLVSRQSRIRTHGDPRCMRM
jgi:hypothetical protein